MCDDVAHTLRVLICLVAGLPYERGMNVFQIEDLPKKRMQSLLRSQHLIEHLLKLIDLAWKVPPTPSHASVLPAPQPPVTRSCHQGADLPDSCSQSSALLRASGG